MPSTLRCSDLHALLPLRFDEPLVLPRDLQWYGIYPIPLQIPGQYPGSSKIKGTTIAVPLILELPGLQELLLRYQGTCIMYYA